VKLGDTESSRGKIAAYGSGENSTLVADVQVCGPLPFSLLAFLTDFPLLQHEDEKRSFNGQTSIIMSTVVTTSVD
jgi:hypothetical protein